MSSRVVSRKNSWTGIDLSLSSIVCRWLRTRHSKYSKADSLPQPSGVGIWTAMSSKVTRWSSSSAPTSKNLIPHWRMAVVQNPPCYTTLRIFIFELKYFSKYVFCTWIWSSIVRRILNHTHPVKLMCIRVSTRLFFKWHTYISKSSDDRIKI